MKSNRSEKNTTPQWQLEKMRSLIASNWDEMWKIVNLRVLNRDRDNSKLL